LMIRLIEKMKAKPEPAPEAPAVIPEDIVLLTEIRDLLKNNK